MNFFTRPIGASGSVIEQTFFFFSPPHKRRYLPSLYKLVHIFPFNFLYIKLFFVTTNLIPPSNSNTTQKIKIQTENDQLKTT